MRTELDAPIVQSEPEKRSAASRARARRDGGVLVRHYVAGGREHGGGIGRLVGYIVDGAGEAGTRHLVTDTRGPRWSPPTSLPTFLGAILVMAKDRVLAPGRIHHIHVAGRGSTTRKCILSAVARMIGCSHIVHLHDFDYAADLATRSPRQMTRIRRLFQGADHVVALGHRDQATVESALGVEPSRLTIVRNCAPDPRPILQTGRATPVILFLGRLSERKGVPELLLALSHPAMASLKWRAVLAGDGPIEEYRKSAAELGLSDRVRIPGWLGRDELRILCNQADMLVLPSHAEGLAMAVVEGLSFGLAVVTTRVGAHEEVIVHNENGLFVPVGDVDALAETMAALVRDPIARSRIAAAGRASYLANFSMTSYGRSIGKIYDAVLSRSGRRFGR